MEVGDWANTAVNLVLGVFVGIAIHGLMQLITTAFWPVAIVISLLFAVVPLIDYWLDWLIDRVFPSGIRAARKPQAEGRTPLPRLLSLPAGLIVGVALARLDLDNAIVGAFS